MLDSSMSEVVFSRNEARFAINSRMSKDFMNWAPDMNKLILICGGEEVGTCEFDLSTYIGKSP